MLVMRRSCIFLMLALAVVVTSCDFMRKMAGRPTSEELKALKGEVDRIESLRREEARVRASLDSLESVRQSVEDSLASSRAKKEDISRHVTRNLENRYYVIIGAFQSYENAKVLMSKADKYGYSPVLIECRNGLIGVGVCPVDEYADALQAVRILRREKFCPEDIWIYTNK